MDSVETPMLDLGDPIPCMPSQDMFTFDMTTHLRYDILAPAGSDRPPASPFGRRARFGPFGCVVARRDRKDATQPC